MGGDIFQNDGAGCDFGAGANGDAPQYFSPRADKNSGFHDGMAVPFFLARAAQRDFMQDGDVVPDDGGFPYHETGGVVQQDAAAESRGTVTCDAAALCLKSGNAVILRGGSESLRTNRALAEVLRAALKESAVPADAVQLLDSGSRDEVRQLCGLDSFLNVIIPRGGKGLIRAVTEYARVPVLKHLDGVCHVYVDAAADLEMAVNVLDDAKTQRPGVCNAAETLLVDAAAAERFLPMAAERMRLRGVECRVCERSRPFFGPEAIPAEEEDWSTEYEDLILSVKVVDGVRDAVEHINHYGSHHSDSIITEDERARDYFMNRVDSACVYHNCSTRFSDGEEFGFGAEIGIGTDKFHARGPMALRELTSYKYVIEGDGQMKDPSRVPRKGSA